MGKISNKGWSRNEKCIVLNMGLVEEVKAVIFGTNQHGIILHTQKKSLKVVTPHLEE